jgi:hypothetical protein
LVAGRGGGGAHDDWKGGNHEPGAEDERGVEQGGGEKVAGMGKR